MRVATGGKTNLVWKCDESVDLPGVLVCIGLDHGSSSLIVAGFMSGARSSSSMQQRKPWKWRRNFVSEFWSFGGNFEQDTESGTCCQRKSHTFMGTFTATHAERGSTEDCTMRQPRPTNSANNWSTVVSARTKTARRRLKFPTFS